MEIVNPIVNITSISKRSHSDLQNLSADDHTQYGTLVGLDANKPSAVSAQRFYYASDTDKLYQSNGTVWAQIATGGGSLQSTLNKSQSFVNLSDSPGAYTGNANKFVGVNNSANGLTYFSSIPAGAPTNPSRAFDTVYQNTTSGNLLVLVSVNMALSNITHDLAATLKIGTSSPPTITVSSIDLGYDSTYSFGCGGVCVAVVPPNYYYEVYTLQTNSLYFNLLSWSETPI